MEKCVFIYFPNTISFEKRDGSGGRIRTYNVSIISLEFYRSFISFSKITKS